MFLTRMVVRCCLLASLALLPGCQPVPPTTAAVEPAAFNGVGYLLFNAPIVPASRDLFIADVGKLHAAGAQVIELGINSPGGEIASARAMVDYMTRMQAQGVTFHAYNAGMVASAATYVFLNAQHRSTGPGGSFLFHAAGAVSTGMVSAERLRDQVASLEEYERIVRDTLRRRTRLSDAEAQVYVRRTVVLNADDARRDGIVDDISPGPVPKGVRVYVIAARPQASATAAPSTPTN